MPLNAERPLISLILPAFNEVLNIESTLADIKQYMAAQRYSYQIIVSADGDDGTRELVAKLAQKDTCLAVTGDVERRGKGYGIRRAIPMATGHYVGIVDADNKTPITEFDKCLPLFDKGCDIVIGSRGVPGAVIEKKQKLYRQIGSRFFGIIMHSLIGLPDIVDTQCGFKFFRHAVAVDLFTRQRIDGYMYDVEILYLAQKCSYRIAQVPVRWHDDGDSRLQLVRGNIRNMIDLFRIRFTSTV